jgi:hypothetical protein
LLRHRQPAQGRQQLGTPFSRQRCYGRIRAIEVDVKRGEALGS